MRTIQEAIRSLDKEELAQAYARIHPRKIEPFYEEEDVDGMPCGEIKKRTREGVAELIDLVCGLETRDSEDGHHCIVFGYPYPIGKYYGENMRQELIYEDELLRRGEEAPAYSYKFTDWAEVLGWHVADTKYPRENLCEIMALVLYEMTWWGFTPEEVAEQREKTFAEIDELEEEEEVDEELAEFRKNFMRELDEYAAIDEARPLEEKLLERQYMQAENTYYSYLRGREMQEIVDTIQRERAKTP